MYLSWSILECSFYFALIGLDNICIPWVYVSNNTWHHSFSYSLAIFAPVLQYDYHGNVYFEFFKLLLDYLSFLLVFPLSVQFLHGNDSFKCIFSLNVCLNRMVASVRCPNLLFVFSLFSCANRNSSTMVNSLVITRVGHEREHRFIIIV